MIATLEQKASRGKNLEIYTDISDARVAHLVKNMIKAEGLKTTITWNKDISEYTVGAIVNKKDTEKARRRL